MDAIKPIQQQRYDELEESHRELFEWMRTHTGPKDGTHEMLVRAYNAIRNFIPQRVKMVCENHEAYLTILRMLNNSENAGYKVDLKEEHANLTLYATLDAEMVDAMSETCKWLKITNLNPPL